MMDQFDAFDRDQLLNARKELGVEITPTFTGRINPNGKCEIGGYMVVYYGGQAGPWPRRGMAEQWIKAHIDNNHCRIKE